MTAPDVRTPAAGPADAGDEEPSADIIAASGVERKREATVTALLAIHRGHIVHRLACGEYLVEWRGCTKHCRDLDELEAHARLVGSMR